MSCTRPTHLQIQQYSWNVKVYSQQNSTIELECQSRLLLSQLSIIWYNMHFLTLHTDYKMWEPSYQKAASEILLILDNLGERKILLAPDRHNLV